MLLKVPKASDLLRFGHRAILAEPESGLELEVGTCKRGITLPPISKTMEEGDFPERNWVLIRKGMTRNFLVQARWALSCCVENEEQEGAIEFGGELEGHYCC